MKKFFAAMLIFIMGLFLYSCNNNNSLNLDITVNNCKDYQINIEKQEIDINVLSDVSEFDLTNITIPDGFTVAFYDLDSKQALESNIVVLKYGLNSYKMEIASKEASDYKLSFTVYVNRLSGAKVGIGIESWANVYYLNDEFKEGKIKVFYEDGHFESVLLTKEMFDSFDTTSYGQKEATISYEEFTLKVEYSVVKKIVDVLHLNVIDSYYVDEEFKASQLLIKYDDKTEETIEVSLDMLSGFDTTIPGEKTVVINYKDFKIEYKINVIEVIATEIVDIKLQNQYFIGDSISEGTIIVKYNNGTIEEKTITADMYSGFDTTTAGVKSLVFTIENVTKTFEIEVKEIKVISIDTINLTNTYLIGDEISNGTIAVTYNNGDKKELAIDQTMYSGFDTTTAGVKTLTFAIDGVTLEFSYEVKNGVKSFEILGQLKYFIDEEINAELKVTYLDKSTKTIKLTKNLTPDFNTSTLGAFKVKVTYGNVEREYSYEVIRETLIEIKVSSDTKSSYFQHEDFVVGNLDLIFDDTRKNTTISLTLDMIKDFDTVNLGNKSTTITYENLTCEFNYEVKERIVESILIKADTLTTVYNFNDQFKEAVLVVNYTNNTFDEITLTLDMITGFDTTKVGEFKAVVNYKGKEISFKYTVNDVVNSVKVVNLISQYYVGQEFVEGLLEVDYACQGLKTISLTLDMVSGFDTSKVTVENVMTIKFGGKEVTHNYSVDNLKIDTMDVVVLPKELYVGSELPSDIVLRITFNLKNPIEVSINDVNVFVTNFDKTKAGKQLITIGYDNGTVKHSIELNITLIEVKAVSITVMNCCNTYLKGETFVEGTLLVSYNNGTTKKVALTQNMLDKFDTTNDGTFTANITYEGLTTQYSYEVKSIIDVNLSSINYFVGDLMSNYKLEVIYSDGKTESYKLDQSFCSGFDTTTEGAKVLKINYRGFNKEIKYNVYKIEVINIELGVCKDVYKLNEQFGETYISVFYNNGKSDYLLVDKSMVVDFDTTIPGAKTMIIRYEGKELMVSYSVISEIISIEIKSFDLVYTLNSKFVDGLLVVNYDGNVKKVVPLTLDMVTGFDTTTLGRKEITITYENHTVKAFITITETELDLPQAEKLTDEALLPVLKRLYVLLIANEGEVDPKNVDLINDDYIKLHCFDLYVQIFEAGNITNEQLIKVRELVDKYDLLNCISFRNPQSLLNTIVNKEKYDSLISALAEFKTIISKSQLSAMINKAMANEWFEYEIFKLEEKLPYVIGTPEEEIIRNQIEVLKNIHNTDFNKRADILELVKIGYDLVDVLVLTSHKDVMTLLSVDQTILSKPDAVIYNVVVVVRNLVKRIIDLGYTNITREFFDCFSKIVCMGAPANMLGTIYTITYIFDNINVFYDVLNLITVDSVKHFKYLISYDYSNVTVDSAGALFSACKEVLRTLKPLLDDMNNNSEFKAEFINLIIRNTGFDYSSFQPILDKALELAKKDIDTIKVEDYIDFINAIKAFTPKHSYNFRLSNVAPLFIKGISNIDALNLLIDAGGLVVVDHNGQPVTLTSLNLVLEDVNSVGYHLGYVKLNNDRFYFNYYIYNSLDDFIVEVENDRLGYNSVYVKFHTRDYSYDSYGEAYLESFINNEFTYVLNSYLKYTFKYNLNDINYNNTLNDVVVNENSTDIYGQNFSYLVSAGFDVNKKGVQWIFIDIKGDKKVVPLIYGNLEEYYFDFINTETGYLKLISPVFVKVDTQELKLYEQKLNVPQLLGINVLTNYLQNLFAIDQTFEFYVKDGRLYIKVGENYYSVASCHYSFNLKNEIIEVNSLSEITDEMLANNVTVRSFDGRILNSHTLISLARQYNLINYNVSSLYDKKEDLKICLTSYTRSELSVLARIILKDNADRVIRTMDDIFNVSFDGNFNFKTIPTAEQFREVLLNKLSYKIITTNGQTIITGADYKKQFEQKYLIDNETIYHSGKDFTYVYDIRFIDRENNAIHRREFYFTIEEISTIKANIKSLGEFKTMPQEFELKDKILNNLIYCITNSNGTTTTLQGPEFVKFFETNYDSKLEIVDVGKGMYNVHFNCINKSTKENIGFSFDFFVVEGK